MAPVKMSHLTSPMVRLKIGKYPDITVFYAHKQLLLNSSPFFSGALNGHFKEGKTGVVPFPDDEPDTIYRMVNWLYTREIDTRDKVVDAAAAAHWDQEPDIYFPYHDDDVAMRSAGDGAAEPRKSPPGLNALFKLWLLGQRLLMPRLQRAVYSKLKALSSAIRSDRRGPVPSVEVLQAVFEETSDIYLLRKIALELAVTTWSMGDLNGVSGKLSGETLEELVKVYKSSGK